jgi:hypothetical protein
LQYGEQLAFNCLASTLLSHRDQEEYKKKRQLTAAPNIPTTISSGLTASPEIGAVKGSSPAMFTIHQPTSPTSKKKIIFSITTSPSSRRRPVDSMELFGATSMPRSVSWKILGLPRISHNEKNKAHSASPITSRLSTKESDCLNHFSVS